MSDKLWRCTNDNCADPFDGSAHDFAAADPVCPKCGRDKKENPDGIVPRAVIHYLVTTDRTGPIVTRNGRRAVACQPLLKKLPQHATVVASCVTCPACLKSETLQEHVEGDVDQDVKMLTFRPV